MSDWADEIADKLYPTEWIDGGQMSALGMQNIADYEKRTTDKQNRQTSGRATFAIALRKAKADGYREASEVYADNQEASVVRKARADGMRQAAGMADDGYHLETKLAADLRAQADKIERGEA